MLDLAGPSGTLAARMLGDMGADVLKIEPPSGDTMRRWAPFVGADSGSMSIPFIANNYNKRSVCVALEDPRSRELFHMLLNSADVLLETALPGEIEATSGVSARTATGWNPHLVWAAVTPFGQDGPRAQWRATDFTLQAAGGLMYLTGEPDGPPVAGGGRVADKMASYVAAMAIVFALLHQRRTGQGQTIDLSVQEAVASQLEWTSVDFIYDRKVSRRYGRLHPAAYPVALYQAKDGWVSLTVGKESHWQSLVEWIGDARILDPVLLDGAERLMRRDEIEPVISQWIADKEKAYLFAEGQRRRIPLAPCASPLEVTADPHLAARKFFGRLSLGGEELTIPGVPFLGANGRLPLRLPPPRLGEHTHAVLRELGFTAAQIDQLCQQRVVLIDE